MIGRKSIKGLIIIGGLLTAIIMISSVQINAVPAFARKYSMSCTTCHAPIPRLKAFGDEFAGNGFEMENQEAKRYVMETGDDRLKLMRALPLAARLDGYLKYQSETDKNVDFSAPYNLKVISGGTLGKNLAYYFYFFLSEHGEVAGIEDAYIMFNNLFNQDLDIYLGQFQVSDPLFKREVRLTYEDYMIYKYHPNQSRIDLAYDKGIMITYGIEGGPDIIFELLNGNGIGKADESRTFDDDKFKTLAGRISYDLIDNIRIGAFGYYGKEGGFFNDTVTQTTTECTNEVVYYGPDMTISIDKLELNLQYMFRRDGNPDFIIPIPAEKYQIGGGMAELIYWPNGDNSRWYAVGLYNHIGVDAGDSLGNQIVYQTITGQLGYMLQTNLRLITEYTYDIENKENRFILGFISGF